MGRQYPEPSSVLPEVWFPGILGEAGDGSEQARWKEHIFSELLRHAMPYARQFTGSISFNHRNKPVRKVSRLPLRKLKLRLNRVS